MYVQGSACLRKLEVSLRQRIHRTTLQPIQSLQLILVDGSILQYELLEIQKLRLGGRLRRGRCERYGGEFGTWTIQDLVSELLKSASKHSFSGSYTSHSSGVVHL